MMKVVHRCFLLLLLMTTLWCLICPVAGKVVVNESEADCSDTSLVARRMSGQASTFRHISDNMFWQCGYNDSSLTKVFVCEVVCLIVIW